MVNKLTGTPLAAIDRMDNKRDVQGAALCPVCSERFAERESVLRKSTFMIHLRCAPEAAQRITNGTLAPTGPVEA